ncbi:MAG: peptide chain release factor 2 [Coriobacteriales bacterium]|jgi:peptide chain release factor 2|nr:peptide chain release factor 2 [Coriobacteriales bacterium]
MATEDTKEQLLTLQERLEQARTYLHLDQKRSKLKDLEAEFSKPDFWDDRAAAQHISRQVSALRDEIAAFERSSALLADAQAAYDLSRDGDETQSSDGTIVDAALDREAQRLIEEITAALDEIELATWFNGEYDHGDAIVSINPGQGGLEAQDWAEMLFKMYLRYAARRGWDVEVLDAPTGEVIGIDSATFIVSGYNAYGMLKAEQGTHRLVRISPTDDKKRRQTTFAGVEVLPVLPDDIAVDIKDEDIRVDVFRSSGPGGQSVNTTDSAVRITHLPTGTVVSCQNEKSQIQNRESAMRILRSRLYELEKAKREEELAKLRGSKAEASWGNQIRNYVLYPYRQIKDVRSNVETGNVDAVLEEGDLDRFVIAYHRWKVGAGQPQGLPQAQSKGSRQAQAPESDMAN